MQVAYLNKETGNSIRAIKSTVSTVVLTDSNFEDMVNAPGKLVLVQFFAPWCQHCKRMAPEYEQLALAFKVRVTPAHHSHTRNSQYVCMHAHL
jgi:thiol-disulfide isomerase/thioredoxin